MFYLFFIFILKKLLVLSSFAFFAVFSSAAENNQVGRACAASTAYVIKYGSEPVLSIAGQSFGGSLGGKAGSRVGKFIRKHTNPQAFRNISDAAYLHEMEEVNRAVSAGYEYDGGNFMMSCNII